MAVSRQTDLFAGSLWSTIYQAFPRINFNATDPVSINQALQNYIQINYPENFNDWIISSEFVAIIDLLSWLAGTLAFKTDIASRENFLDTAEAKENVLRLARFLSYNPSRCQPSTGILKITEIYTDDDVYDSFGTDLINTTVVWNDPNNSNWFDQFTSVMNAAFVNTNPFGIPISDGTVAAIDTQLYRLNGLSSNSSLNFSSNVSGTPMDFEVCNGDFTSDTSSATGQLFERNPDQNNAFQFYYLNDNKGNSSPRTGFFFLFKQGTTQKQTFQISVPIENQLVDITTRNINQNDVWVNTINDTGTVLINWTKVQAVFNSNITYNNIPINQRNIFSVITRDNDEITIRFSDGRFGNAPSGNIQIVYRVSNALTYQIKPSEIDGIQLQFSYINTAGSQQTLYVTFSLQEIVSNAAASETTDSIRQNAPQVYSTQGRMVSGEDYNIFPLSSNLAVKINAINRIYSGQSRYIDLQDPTGTYQDLSLFAEDGIFFKEIADNYFEIPLILNKSAQDIISGYILPALTQYTVSNLIRDVLLQNTYYITTTVPTTVWSSGSIIDVHSLGITWTAANSSLFQTTGWFSTTQNLIQPGAIIQFNIGGVMTWIAVSDVQGAINSIPLAGVAGPVTLSQEVPVGSIIEAILPCAYVTPSSTVITTIQTNIDTKLSFSLWYDYSNSNLANGPVWVVRGPANDFGEPDPEFVNIGGANLIQIMNVNYITGMWRITTQGMRYVFESIAKIQWFDNGRRNLAQYTGEAQPDLIRVMKINTNLNDGRGYALQKYYDLAIDRMWSYQDGTSETRRTTVLLYDSNLDGYPDVPDAYYQVISNQYQDNYLFWSNAAKPPYDEPLSGVVVYDTDTLLQADNSQAIGTVGFQVESIATYLDDETFWVWTAGSPNAWVQDLYGRYRIERGRGQNIAALWVTNSENLVPICDDIIFQWKHYATIDQRIDPSSSNIIDIFVLTYAYDTAIRQWIVNGADLSSMPIVPTELDLSLAFSSIEQYKMFSDEIIWRPVSYKFLFGTGADPENTAQLKVVRMANASVSDGQIQSQIINAVNAYFGVSRWNFGDTFFASEMIAYIHQRLVNLVSSVVLVPLAADGAFGDGYEIDCNPDEIFISTLTVSGVIIITSNTATNLRIRG
jgi:hypothetical protein